MKPREQIFDEELFEDFGPDCFLPFPRHSVQRLDASVPQRRRPTRVLSTRWPSIAHPAVIESAVHSLSTDDNNPANDTVQSSDNESDLVIEELRAGVRKQVPRVPGVYGMLDLRGRLIYVGKSKSLRGRLLSYFLPHNEEEKAGRIVQTTQSIVWEPQPSEFAALLREQYLIRQFQPRFNVQGMPKRQRPVFLALGKPPAEMLYVSHLPDSRALACQGPLMGSGRVRRAVEVLNRIFGLRDCSNQTSFSFTDQLSLFDLSPRPGCLRLELQTCLGPCAGACNRARYEQHVHQARAFLAGENEQPIQILQQQMQNAAERMHFEQAARLRDDLKHVEWLSRKLKHFAEARQKFSFVYPVKGVDGRDCWYIVRHGELCAVLSAPRTKPELKKATRIVNEWLSEQPQVGKSIPSRPETVALISGWFRSNRAELKQVFTPDSLTASSV